MFAINDVILNQVRVKRTNENVAIHILYLNKIYRNLSDVRGGESPLPPPTSPQYHPTFENTCFSSLAKHCSSLV